MADLGGSLPKNPSVKTRALHISRLSPFLSGAPDVQGVLADSAKVGDKQTLPQVCQRLQFLPLVQRQKRTPLAKRVYAFLHHTT